MAQQTNQHVAALLRELARYRYIEGSTWGHNAYKRAAETVEQHPAPVARMDEDQLLALPKIGPKLASSIAELAQGQIPESLEEARDKWPPSIFSMTCIVGIGDKRAIKLYEQYGFTSFEAAHAAALAGEIDDARLTDAIVHAANMSGRIPWSVADKAVQTITARLTLGKRLRLTAVGSYRRRAETVGDIDFLFTTRYPKRRERIVRRFIELGATIVAGEQKSSIYWQLDDGTYLRVDLLVINPAEYGAALLYFTGNAEHNIALRKRAIRKGMRLNEHGLWQDGELVVASTERAIYEALDITPTPPWYRDGQLRRQNR